MAGRRRGVRRGPYGKHDALFHIGVKADQAHSLQYSRVIRFIRAHPRSGNVARSAPAGGTLRFTNTSFLKLTALRNTGYQSP